LNNTLKIFFLSIVVISSYFYLFEGEDSDKYIDRILEERKVAEKFFKSSSTSPFIGKEFNGLNYFPPDISFKTNAIIVKLEKIDTVMLKTFDNKEVNYLKFAIAKMKLKGEKINLILFKELNDKNNNVFLMFNDQTNGDQTYSGGRYIDLNFKNSKRIEIDFNKAYNPYCEYDIKYTCPIPPKENKISIKILAGEKKYFN
tara:strand:+ start:398 stop:997 length:600 start_codon:yes stop_codon:yes gene_type:complete